jgi:hypothetical protein
VSAAKSVPASEMDALREVAHQLGKLEGWTGEADKRLDRIETNVSARLAAHDATSREGIAALRQDIVNAHDRIRGDIAGHETRLDTLEKDKAARGGAFKLVEILKEYSPWGLVILTALIAYLK